MDNQKEIINVPTSWNFRVVTSVVKGCRFFDIAEVYYEEGVATNYAAVGYGYSLASWDTLEDLKESYEKMGSAFTKPIIDLDNFPEIYQET